MYKNDHNNCFQERRQIFPRKLAKNVIITLPPVLTSSKSPNDVIERKRVFSRHFFALSSGLTGSVKDIPAKTRSHVQRDMSIWVKKLLHFFCVEKWRRKSFLSPLPSKVFRGKQIHCGRLWEDGCDVTRLLDPFESAAARRFEYKQGCQMAYF
jgi:hypothetical protein